MDDRHFDSLVKSLASGASRRKILKGILGLGGLGVASHTLDAGAARRPAPTPTPQTCPGKQVWSQSGCTCPDGLSKCGPDCCNPSGVGADHSVCCDNACCFGTCHGEELCCPSTQEYCAVTGGCCPAGLICCPTSGCIRPDQCCTADECPAQECMAPVCTADHTCSYVEDCRYGTDCCYNDCARTACLPNGLCGGQFPDCRNGGTERCCQEGYECSEDGICTCVPTCGDAVCGQNGCGGSCGECESNEVCTDGQCICTPVCTEPNGQDGCGNECPGCEPGDPNRCDADPRCQCLQRADGSYLWAEDIIEMNCDRLGCPYDDVSLRDYECVGGDICILTCLCGA